MNRDLCCHRDAGSGRCQGKGRAQDYSRETFNVRGLNASIFVLFFFKWPKISKEIRFSAPEGPIMKSKGRTARTTASRTVCMNTGRVVGESRLIKTRNNPILKSKIRAF